MPHYYLPMGDKSGFETEPTNIDQLAALAERVGNIVTYFALSDEKIDLDNSYVCASYLLPIPSDQELFQVLIFDRVTSHTIVLNVCVIKNKLCILHAGDTHFTIESTPDGNNWKVKSPQKVAKKMTGESDTLALEIQMCDAVLTQSPVSTDNLS